ncbi:MAG: acylphosphatase [Miltoncostaeaceae bacterium]|nr:acylphosphatase [Miltoncostaeaceae bacterium]
MRRRAIVRGLVQGVYFRDTAREAAEAHGVTGWAANLPDGTVELVLEGAPEDVEAVLTVARRGPPDAHVTGIEVAEEPVESLSGFRVL